MFKEGLRKMGGIMAPQDVEKVFAACDRNGDGQLDVEECDVGDEAAQQLRALERLATRSDPASYLQVYVS